MSVENQSLESDSFIVAFQGALVECQSLEDAIAVKTAHGILADRTEYDFAPRELDRLAEVLIDYKLAEAGETLIRMGAKLRAAQFLVQKVGYLPPPHRGES